MFHGKTANVTTSSVAGETMGGAQAAMTRCPNWFAAGRGQAPGKARNQPTTAA
jgi:hypothetical protein